MGCVILDADCVVIGAGVLGLAVARRLAETGQQVVVLEAEKTIGTQTSSRNSEVIHAGLYHPEGSLKARSCVAGRKKLYAYCEARKIPARKIGKLIVATQEAQVGQLKALLERGKANGVGDLIWMQREEAARIEPEVACVAAVYSPSTGIVDSAALMLCLQADAENSAALSLFAPMRRGWKGVARASRWKPPRRRANPCSAAAWSTAPDMARRILRAKWRIIRPNSSRRVFSPREIIVRFPDARPFPISSIRCPCRAALGVHVTLDLAGRMRLGPDLQWVDNLDYRPTVGVEADFRAAVAGFWPGILRREIATATCGVRPKISGPGEPAADFRVDGPSVHGIAGLVSCFGIELPGLTAALALAEVIARELEK